LTSLVKKIDRRLEAEAGKGPRPPGVYVLFDSTPGGLDNQLRALAQKESLKHVLFGIGPPPRDYEVSREADVTVVIYKIGNRRLEPVTANFALRECELDDDKIDAIVGALCQVLDR
jgi:hypothetical protein